MHYTLNIIHCTLDDVHCTIMLYIRQYTACTNVHCTLDNTQFAHGTFIGQCTKCIDLCIAFIMHILYSPSTTINL